MPLVPRSRDVFCFTKNSPSSNRHGCLLLDEVFTSSIYKRLFGMQYVQLYFFNAGKTKPLRPNPTFVVLLYKIGALRYGFEQNLFLAIDTMQHICYAARTSQGRAVGSSSGS